MKTTRTLGPMLFLLTAVAACSGEAASGAGAESAGSAQSKATAGDGERGAKGENARAMMPPGPGGLLFAALHEDIKLTEAQRTAIEALATQAHPSPLPDAGDKAKALAAAVRSGSVDAAVLQPSPDATRAMHEEHAAKLATTLATLHDTLSKEQRAALVDAVKAKAAEHGPKGHGPHGQRGDHGPHDGPPPDGMGGPHGGPMHLLAGLDLSDAQKKQIHDKLAAARPAPPSDAERETMRAKHEEMKKAFGAKLESFKADAFDAKAFVAPPEGAGKPEMGPPGHQGLAAHMAKELSIIVSVLDASQREKLAAKLEQGPPARPMR